MTAPRCWAQEILSDSRVKSAVQRNQGGRVRDEQEAREASSVTTVPDGRAQATQVPSPGARARMRARIIKPLNEIHMRTSLRFACAFEPINISFALSTHTWRSVVVNRCLPEGLSACNHRRRVWASSPAHAIP